MPADTWAARKLAELEREWDREGASAVYGLLERAIAETIEECARLCDEADERYGYCADDVRALLEPKEPAP